MHDDVPQRCGTDQRCQLAHQFTGGKRGDGAAVGDDVAQLVLEQHGVGRHHHRIRTQDGKVGGNELRAVLAEQHHAVAGLHAASLLQVARQALHLIQ
ncbi:hypothetical protein D9M68_992530 [compost metagenome]